MKTSGHKILLTGANGTLGRAIRKMAATDTEFVCLDISDGGDPSIHRGSFTDAALVNDLIAGCDAVIHTASLHGGNKNTHNAIEFTHTNIVGLVTLLEAALTHQVGRFVFSSTLEVLIGVDWKASGMTVVDETCPVRSDWIYPATKFAGETLGSHYYRNFGLEFIALRYMEFTTTTKPGPDFLARCVAPDDVATANLLAATKPDLGYQVIHIGPLTPLDNYDIPLAAVDPFAVVEKYWPGSTAVLKANQVALSLDMFWPITRIDQARRVLGWQPVQTFESYLLSLGWKPPAAP